MRILQVSLIAAAIAAISCSAQNDNTRYRLKNKEEFSVSTATGAIAISNEKVYIGTSSGTVEERADDGTLLSAQNKYVKSGGDEGTFASSNNRMGSFSQLVPGDKAFYLCSSTDNAVYRYTMAPNQMHRLAGDGTAGLTSGKGAAAKIDCGDGATSSVHDQGRTKVYMFSGRGSASTHALVAITANEATTADQGELAILVGSGVASHKDGTGTTAALKGMTSMMYWGSFPKEYLILGSTSSDGPLRYVDLTTAELKSTQVRFDAAVESSGDDGAAGVAGITGLALMPGRTHAFGMSGSSKAFGLHWADDLSTFQLVLFNTLQVPNKVGAAMNQDGSRVFFGNGAAGSGNVASFEHESYEYSGPPPPAPAGNGSDNETNMDGAYGASSSSVVVAAGSLLMAFMAACL